MPVSPSVRRYAVVVVAALCGWAAALGAPRDFPVGSFGDDARYAVLAKSLRESGRYRLLQLPGEPAETMYPPGFSGMLALVWSPARSDTANLERTRWVNLALVGPLAASLCVAGIELFALPPAVSAVLAVAGVTAPAVMAFWMLPLSETLCLLLVAIALTFANGRSRERRIGGLVLLVLAAYVRTIALAFLLGHWIVAWRRGERRRVGAELAAVAVALAPWGLWTVVHAGDVPPALYGMYGSYAQWYAASLTADPTTMLFQVPVQNLWMLLLAVCDPLTGFLPIRGVLAAALGAAALWVAWRGRRAAAAATPASGAPAAGGSATVAGLCCYVAVVLLWPFPPFRFVGAVWPLALLAAAAGARVFGTRVAWAVALGALVLASVGFARRGGVREGRARADWRTIVGQVRPLIPTGAVLSSSNPALYYLVLGARGVPNERMRSYRYYRLGYWSTAWGLGDDLWAIVRAYHPDYDLVERRETEGRYAAGSLMRQCPGVLREIWKTPADEYLFAVRSDVPCAPVRVRP